MSILNLTMTPYSDDAFSTKAGSPYVVMLNPDKLSFTRSAEYNATQAQNSPAQTPTFIHSPPADVSFEIIIDCTGVVDLTRTSMDSEITALTSVIYSYDNSQLKPSNVLIEWGTEEILRAVLTKYDITYTLFHPLGKPLRAKVSLSFKQVAAPPAQLALPSSALSQLISAVDGDTLPGIALLALGSSALFVELALANGLDKLRSLPAATTLSV